MRFPEGITKWIPTILWPATLTFFASENVTSLNEEEKSSCEGVVSEDECLRTLKEFKNCKSPGTEGLSAQFYKFFGQKSVPI